MNDVLLTTSSGIETKFGVMVGRLEWLENKESWSLTGSDGQDLGQFNGVIASDKSTFSHRSTQVTGKPPPLGIIVLVLIGCNSLSQSFKFTSISFT